MLNGKVHVLQADKILKLDLVHQLKSESIWGVRTHITHLSKITGDPGEFPTGFRRSRGKLPHGLSWAIHADSVQGNAQGLHCDGD